MAIRGGIRPSSGKREKRGRGLVIRHRKEGAGVPKATLDPVEPDRFSKAPVDENNYIDVEWDGHGDQVTNIGPDGVKPA